MSWIRLLAVLGSIVATATIAVVGWRYYEVNIRWRDLTPAVSQFLMAAQSGDTATLQRMASSPEPVQRVLGLARVEPAQFDTLVRSLRLEWAHEMAPDDIVLTFRTRSTLCRYAEG